MKNRIVGLGALQRRRPRYAARRAKAGRFDFDPNMHEIGYVVVRKAFGRRGICGQILGALLSAVRAQSFGATTFTEYMERTLAKAGFEQRGEPWEGASGNTVRLWIKDYRGLGKQES